VRRALAGLALGLSAAAGVAAAQPSQPAHRDRSITRVVGTPPGARVDRVDPRRSGASPTPLPSGSLRVAWRAAVKVPLEHAPLVDARGNVYVVGARGEVASLSADGAERWQVATSMPVAGPAALLSDDTVAFVGASGDAVAVRDGKVRWRTNAGAPDVAYVAAPIALDDGGVVVASGPDLAAIDAEGQLVGRAHLPEPVAAPLLATGDRVLAVSASGVVWSWVPGALDVRRIGTFETPVEGSVALVDPDTALAVTHSGARLTELRLRDGTTRIRASSGGTLWPGSPAVSGGVAFIVALTASSELAVAFDREGRELGSALIQSQSQATASDAGALLMQSRPTPLLADSTATIIFATSTGGIGVVRRLGQPDEAVESVSVVCSLGAAGGSPPVSGMAPLAPRTIVATCHHGEVVAVSGS
jgi:hypothetical protein